MFETFYSTFLSKWSLNVILLSTSGIASISLLSMKVEGAHPSLSPILTNHHPSAVFSLTWEQALPMLEYYWIINTMHNKSKWYHLTVKNKRKLGNTSLIFCYFTLHLWHTLYTVIIILNITFFFRKKNPTSTLSPLEKLMPSPTVSVKSAIVTYWDLVTLGGLMSTFIYN